MVTAGLLVCIPSFAWSGRPHRHFHKRFAETDSPLHKEAFADVPRGHWAYGMLERTLTAFPYGCFTPSREVDEAREHEIQMHDLRRQTSLGPRYQLDDGRVLVARLHSHILDDLQRDSGQPGKWNALDCWFFSTPRMTLD